MSMNRNLSWSEINKSIKENYGNFHEVRSRVLNYKPYASLIKKATTHGKRYDTKQYYVIPPLLGGQELVWLTDAEHTEQLKIWRKLFPTWAHFYKKNISDAYKTFKRHLTELESHPEYAAIIQKALKRGRDKLSGYELHHIVPKCIGGFDIRDNMVLLTHKEHIICHELLCNIYPNERGLQYCFDLMTNKPQKIFKELQERVRNGATYAELSHMLDVYEHTVWLYNKQCETTRDMILNKMKQLVVKDVKTLNNNTTTVGLECLLGICLVAILLPIALPVLIVIFLLRIIEYCRKL